MKKGQRKNSKSLSKPKPFYSRSKKRWIAKVLVANGKYVERRCDSKSDAYDKIEELWDSRLLIATTSDQTVKQGVQ